MQMELLQAVLENSFDATFACDETGKIIFSNKKARELPELATHELVLSSLVKALRGEATKDLEICFASRYLMANAQSLTNDQLHIIGAMITLQDITESKQTNERLYSRFGAIFYQSPFSIQILAKDGRTLMVNPGYRNLWGISEEIVENYVYKIYNILEDKLLKESGQLSDILRGFSGEIVQIPPFHYDPSKLGFPGRARWAGGLIYPLKDASGEVQEVVIIHRDMTDQYTATLEKEELLSQLTNERNRLSTILNQMPVGVLVADAPYGDISLRNKRMINIIKKMPYAQNMSEFMGHKLYFSDGRPYEYQDFPAIRSLKGEVVYEEEMRVVYDDGDQSIFSISSAPIRDANEEIKSCVVVTSDITQKKRIEGIQKFMDRLKSVLLTSLNMEQSITEFAKVCVPFMCDGIYVDMLDGNEVKRVMIHHWEPERKKIMEEITEAFPPKINSEQPSMRTLRSGHVHFERRVAEDYLKAVCFNDSHIEKIRKLGINSSIAVPLTIRNKTFGTISFLNTTPGRFLDDLDLSTSIDIGKHASLALDNSLLYKESQAAIKLREEFISMASHELKTPLTSMNLQMAVLNSILKNLEAEESDHALKVLSKTQKQIERLTKLIDDMLDISRIESGKFAIVKQDMDLTKTTQDVLERFADQFNSLGILVNFEAPGPVMMKGDAYRMDQVVTNFITNAIRYGNNKPIEVRVYSENNHVYLTVQDHGHGIPKNEQLRIFNRFERSEKSQHYPGLGLGLYINREIVQEHGGTIRVESELEQGATFIVEI